MRSICGFLLVALIAACSVTPEVKETPIAELTESAPLSSPAEDTEIKETAETQGAAATSETLNGEQISLLTDDGVQLSVVFYAPDSLIQDSRVLILVHEAFRDRSSWDDFSIAAQEDGYAVIALDLRGHGKSMGEKTFDQAMDQDVDAVLEWIRASPDLNKDHIAIAGASLGANLALRAGARDPQINTLVLLSPGLKYWELEVENAMHEYGRRPVLLVASEEDGYSAVSVQRLNEIGPGYDKLVLYPGEAHGTEMIRSQPDLTVMMLDWFDQTMK